MKCKECGTKLPPNRLKFCSIEHSLKFHRRKSLQKKYKEKQKDIKRAKKQIPNKFIIKYKKRDFIPSVELGQLKSEYVSGFYRKIFNTQINKEYRKIKQNDGTIKNRKVKILNTKDIYNMIQHQHKKYKQTARLDYKNSRNKMINILKELDNGKKSIKK